MMKPIFLVAILFSIPLKAELRATMRAEIACKRTILTSQMGFLSWDDAKKEMIRTLRPQHSSARALLPDSVKEDFDKKIESYLEDSTSILNFSEYSYGATTIRISPLIVTENGIIHGETYEYEKQPNYSAVDSPFTVRERLEDPSTGKPILVNTLFQGGSRKGYSFGEIKGGEYKSLKSELRTDYDSRRKVISNLESHLKTLVNDAKRQRREGTSLFSLFEKKIPNEAVLKALDVCEDVDGLRPAIADLREEVKRSFDLSNGSGQPQTNNHK